jgi:5-methylcytosine-specific restriction endonuclease McrA
MQDVKHGTWDELYRTPKWRALRSEKLRQNPSCEICGQPATEVHHKVPHRGDMDLFLDWDNLMSICSKCHGLQTRKEVGDRTREFYEKQKKEREIQKRKPWY